MAQLSLYIGYKAPFHTPRPVLVALVFLLLNALTYNTFRLLSSGGAAGAGELIFVQLLFQIRINLRKGLSSATEIFITTSPNVARK